MFQKALQFKDVIILYYSRQNIVRINGRVLLLLIYHIFKIIVDSLFPIVITCVINQYKSHWLLFDALKFAITMCLKFREKIINPSIPINLSDDDYGITFEFYLLISNIIKEICGVLDSFLSFLIKFGKKKPPQHVFFMLGLRFKNLCLISFLLAERKV